MNEARSPDLLAEAIMLVADLHVARDPLEAMDAMETWAAQSDRHGDALIRAQSTWVALAPAKAGRWDASPAPLEVVPLKGRRTWLAAAAATAAVAWLAIGLPMLATQPDRYATRAGERRTVQLADGSVMTLDGRTQVEVRITGSKRDVAVIAGRVQFRVAHDAGRPFGVSIGSLGIRDVGTVFTVDRRDHAVAVAVTQGIVDIGVDAGTALRRVTAGQMVRFNHGALGATHRFTGKADGWQTGRFDYNHARLDDVLIDVNRHAARPVAIDAAARDLAFTGSLRGEAIDEWLQALPMVLPVRVIREGDHDRIVRRRVPMS